MSLLTPLGAIARGAAAGVAGTAALDLVWFRRYRRGGGADRLRDWELATGLDSWDDAPAPAIVGRRLTEGFLQQELPPSRAPLVTNVTHWVYGVAMGSIYGVLAGSRPRVPTVPAGRRSLIETAHDAATFTPKDPNNLAFVTQTTLSIDDTKDIVAILKGRFPNISGPHKEDICYATTNRQLAVKKVAPVVDALIVVGAPNSSNSQRLREVAEREGCPIAVLAQRAGDLDWKRFEGIKSLGITAGASAPEVIVEEIMGAFAERYELHVETVSAAEENEFFQLPRSLRPDAA